MRRIHGKFEDNQLGPFEVFQSERGFLIYSIPPLLLETFRRT